MEPFQESHGYIVKRLDKALQEYIKEAFEMNQDDIIFYRDVFCDVLNDNPDLEDRYKDEGWRVTPSVAFDDNFTEENIRMACIYYDSYRIGIAKPDQRMTLVVNYNLVKGRHRALLYHSILHELIHPITVIGSNKGADFLKKVGIEISSDELDEDHPIAFWSEFWKRALLTPEEEETLFYLFVAEGLNSQKGKGESRSSDNTPENLEECENWYEYRRNIYRDCCIYTSGNKNEVK